VLRLVSAVATICLAFGLLLSAVAKEKKDKVYAPLPRKILEAKTIAFDNRTGWAKYGDAEYTAIVDWGRFKIVEKSEKPDLIFLFALRRRSARYETSGHADTTNPERTAIQAETTAVGTEIPYLSIIDPSSGETIWSMTGSDGVKIPKAMRVHPVFWLARNQLGPVGELRKRIEIQEKSTHDPAVSR
jgi:hypothetical protein